MRDELLIAYMAGVIDADGFISAHKKRHGSKVYYGPLIGISGTSPEPHERAHALWGGSFFTYRPKNRAHRVQFQWQAVGKRAAIAIAAIRPHLLTKIAQADLALEMWRMIDAGAHRTDARLADMAHRLSAMNIRMPPRKQTGKAPIPPDLMVRQFPSAQMRR